MLKLGEVVLRKKRHGSADSNREKKAHGEAEAGRLVAERMAVAGLSEEDLVCLPGSEARKVTIARRVWEETTVGLQWISDRLSTRNRANASQQIRYLQAMPKLPKGNASMAHSVTTCRLTQGQSVNLALHRSES